MNKPAAAIGLALAACAHAPPAVDHSASLAAAETAFAAHSVRENMRVAFLAAFDHDGVFVREGWRVSNDFLRDRPAPAIVLDWRPQYVEASASGDLGLSTGPSKIVSTVQPDAPPSYGQFVSVWRRAPGEAWKVAVDLGIGHAGDHLWNEPLERRLLPQVGRPVEAGSVEQAEERFATEAQSRGLRTAYAAFGADNLRFYRAGHPPATTRAAALVSPGMEGTAPAWTVERSETSRAGDLAYVRGAYTQPGSPTPLGWYLRVWRREANGWRIVMDVTNPSPKKP